MIIFCSQILAALLMVTARVGQATIAGLTYMDKMDYAERYRNVHECDPFYYHPLHLPDYCADMFEKLIRSRIGSRGALRVIKAANPPRTRSYDYDSDVDVEYRKLTPYEEILFSLQQDVEDNPSSAQVMWSNLGPVAVYRQPISRASKDGIAQYFKNTWPKMKRPKKHLKKMEFTLGNSKVELDIDKQNDDYVIVES